MSEKAEAVAAELVDIQLNDYVAGDLWAGRVVKISRLFGEVVYWILVETGPDTGGLYFSTRDQIKAHPHPPLRKPTP